MNARKAPETPTDPSEAPAPAETSETSPEATQPQHDAPGFDLANVNPAGYAVPGATGTVIDGVIDDQTDEAPAETELPTLKALGNAKADVNVTAVQNGHGTWTWTARATEDGRKLAAGGPHLEARMHENLVLLFGGQSTIALHRTGDDKTRRLA